MSEDFLKKILASQQEVVQLARRKHPPADLERTIAAAARSVHDFAGAFRDGHNEVKVLAELKKASPSKGLIRPDFAVEALAVALAANGAAALSVLTEPHYFLGAIDNLQRVRAALPEMPLLRKDFLFDPYQIAEARAAGADAVLLIVRMLSKEQFTDLCQCAKHYGLAVLAEIHEAAELETALSFPKALIGINCRDLRTFATDLATTEKLLHEIPQQRIAIAESGLNSHRDLIHFQALGARGFLIGESLMRAASPGEKLKELIHGC